jgi:hypothetical protein
MKSLILSLTAVSALLSPVLASASSTEMVQVERMVVQLENQYPLNIKLIPQPMNSENLWLQDLNRLNKFMNNQIYLKAGSIRTLSCDKIVCRGE